MTQTLFNPFIKIAGTKSLALGWAAILITAMIAYFSHIHFTGAIDAKIGGAGSWWLFLLEPVVSWLSVVISMYVAGMVVVRSSVRWIDIAGTMALARWPMFFVALLGFIPVDIPTEVTLDISAYTSAIILGLAMLPFTIWMIVLMYQGYKVSTGTKGTQSILSFIIALVSAEILSFIVFLTISRYTH